jgi:serine/threonine-protein kinase
VTRALAKQPSARFQSALEFRAALEEAWPASGGAAIASHAIDATAVLPVATTPATYLPAVAIASGEEPYRRQRSDSRAGIVAALVIAVLVLVPVVQTLLPGAASASSTVAPSSPSATATTMAVVPLLAGTLQDAQAALAAQGFVVGQVTTKNSNQVEGRLLEQQPGPGSLSPRGSAVDLDIASGRNVVPQVGGQTLATATAQIKAAGFAVTGRVSAGSLVAGSSPAGGQVVRVGSTVTLVADTATPAPSTSQPSDSPSTSTESATPSATPASTSSSPSATRTTTPSASGGA